MSTGRARGWLIWLNPRWIKAFGRHLVQQFRDDRSLEAAAALSYTSLLALVPLLVVIFGVVSAFPIFERWADEVEAFIFDNFVPAAGDVVNDYLTQFVERAGELTGPGSLFLIVTAIMLMWRIERSINRIWRVRVTRRPLNRLVIYWAVLTLGPLLVGASLVLTSYLAALPMLAPELVRGLLQEITLRLAPFMVTLIAFTLIFVLVPNRRVRWRHALVGATLAALMFELAKAGFVGYVSHFPTHERVYGALATLPLFLIWIYVCWTVVLLGASVSAALTTFDFRRVRWRWSSRHELLLALRFLGHFWQAQRRGEALSVQDLLAREPAATDSQSARILGYFHDARFIHPDNDGDWLLSADLDELTLGELYRSGSFILPVGELDDLPHESYWDRALIDGLQAVDERAEPLMRRPVKSLLKFELEEE
ncbi:MAG: virulence factor BrkB family protein [Wenzhouxiangella sp.]